MARVQLTVFIPPEVASEIKALAREQGISMGLVGARFLEHGFRSGQADNQAAVVMPTLEHFISKMVRGEFKRMMYFVVRLTIETNALRRQVYSLHLESASKEQARISFDRSYENAVKALKKRMPEVEAVAGLLEQFEPTTAASAGGEG